MQKLCTFSHELDPILKELNLFKMACLSFLQLILDVQGFVFKVDADKDGNLISLITMRGKVHAEVKDWSDKVILSLGGEEEGTKVPLRNEARTTANQTALCYNVKSGDDISWSLFYFLVYLILNKTLSMFLCWFHTFS